MVDDIPAIADNPKAALESFILELEFGELRSGITQTQFSKRERGKNAPTVELLLKLKHISGKSIDWIVTGEI